MKQKTEQITNNLKEVELGEVIKLKGGYAFKSEEFVKEGIPIIRISNFNNNDVDLTDAVYYPKNKLNIYKEFLLNDSNILIAMSGATTGKIGMVIKKNVPCLLNQRVGKFEITNKNLLSKYLLMFVKSSNFQKEVFRIASGCAQPNISTKQIESIKIPLPFKDGKPDLKEQERIVSILGKAESLKQKGKRAEDLLNEYLKSVFYEMFLKEKNKFEWKILSDICEIKGGKRLPKGELFSNLKTNRPYLRVTDMRNKTILTEDIKYINEKIFSKIKNYTISKEDVYITIAGTLGLSGIIPNEYDGASLTENAAKLIIKNKEELNKIYLAWIISSSNIQKQIRQKQGMVGVPKLALFRIETIKIPLPSRSLQQKFAEIVEHVEGFKENVKKTKQNSEELFNSLMHKGFRGEL